MGKLRHLKTFVAGLILALLSCGLTHASASASANLSHAYQATATIPNGSLVVVDSTNSDNVDLADTSNGASLLGIAVNSDDSLLAVDAGSAKVQVAISGTANALVSTVNGNIADGGPVGVSPFGGIGMKAAPSSHVIGVAEAAFSSKSPGAVQRQVKDKTGATHTVWVGFIPVSIDVGTSAAPAGGAKLNSLQRLIKSLSGRTIPTSRIIVSIAVALVALTILITLIHASIYGGLVSIGRNPLAKHAVFRILIYITGMAVMTTGVAAAAIFLLLS